MDTEQAALGGVLDTDQHDPAIQAASAVTGLPQALSPSAEPPWPRDLAETIASFLCPVDALALDAAGRATRCVTVERFFQPIESATIFASPDQYEAEEWFDVELGGAPRPPVRGKLHTVGITFLWNDQGWGGQKGMLSVVRDGGKAPDDYAPWSPDVMCGKEPAPHVETSDYMEFRPHAGEGYAIWYRVGGGGGHELIIHRIEVYRLRYS